MFWSKVGAESKDLFQEVDLADWRANELGFIQIDSMDEVLAIAPLGRRVIVYGDKSIGVLEVKADGEIEYVELAGMGVQSRRSYSTSKGGGHLFVGSNGRAYSISYDLSIRELGFEEFLLSPPATVVVLRDEIESLWYLSDGQNTYILNEEGKMGSTSVSYTGVIDHNGESKVATSSGGGLRGALEGGPIGSVTIVPLDFGRRDIKTLTGIQVYSDRGQDTKVSVATRYGANEEWVDGLNLPLNTEGYVRIQASGVEFRITILGTAIVKSIDVRYQTSGKRFIRGTSAAPTDL